MVRRERHRLGHVKFAKPLRNGRANPSEAQGKATKEASLVFLKLLTFVFLVFLPSLLPIFRSCRVQSCLDSFIFVMMQHYFYY